MKRKSPSLDNRLDWRDPSMPVLGKSGRPIDYKKMEQKAQMALMTSFEPTFRNDPTYNLRKKHK